MPSNSDGNDSSWLSGPPAQPGINLEIVCWAFLRAWEVLGEGDFDPRSERHVEALEVARVCVEVFVEEDASGERRSGLPTTLSVTMTRALADFGVWWYLVGVAPMKDRDNRS